MTATNMCSNFGGKCSSPPPPPPPGYGVMSDHRNTTTLRSVCLDPMPWPCLECGGKRAKIVLAVHLCQNFRTSNSLCDIALDIKLGHSFQAESLEGKVD